MAAPTSSATVIITEPGPAPSTVVVKERPPPVGGRDPVAFHATYISGGEAGFEFTQILAGVDDSVVEVGFVGTDPARSTRSRALPWIKPRGSSTRNHNPRFLTSKAVVSALMPKRDQKDMTSLIEEASCPHQRANALAANSPESSPIPMKRRRYVTVYRSAPSSQE